MNRQLLEREFLRLRDLATTGNEYARVILHNAVITIVGVAYPQRSVPRQYYDYPAEMLGEVTGLCHSQSVDDATVHTLLSMTRSVQ